MRRWCSGGCGEGRTGRFDVEEEALSGAHAHAVVAEVYTRRYARHALELVPSGVGGGVHAELYGGGRVCDDQNPPILPCCPHTATATATIATIATFWRREVVHGAHAECFCVSSIFLGYIYRYHSVAAREESVSTAQGIPAMSASSVQDVPPSRPLVRFYEINDGVRSMCLGTTFPKLKRLKNGIKRGGVRLKNPNPGPSFQHHSHRSFADLSDLPPFGLLDQPVWSSRYHLIFFIL